MIDIYAILTGSKNTMRVTLRIKRIYFDAIRRGEKTYELREHTEHYQKKFDGKKIDVVMFHYQSGDRLYVEVEKIRLIDTPSTSTLMKTKKCYRMFLGKVIKTERAKK